VGFLKKIKIKYFGLEIPSEGNKGDVFSLNR
jgi:hypothetical protein